MSKQTQLAMDEFATPSTNETANADTASSIDDIDGTTPPEIVQKFHDMNSWAETVHINGRDTAMLAGEKVEQNPESVQVYYHPQDPTHSGLAGTLKYDRELLEPDSEVVAFEPAGDNRDDIIPVEHVTELSTEQHSRTEQLDEVLNTVKTNLTDSDWSSGRADTGYGEWVEAALSLVDFQSEFYGDDQPFVLPVNTWTRDRVTHAVARYPLEGCDFISHVTNSILGMDDGAHNANPEAIRTVIVDYAKTQLDDDSMDFTIEPSMGLVD
jgi:hypothetical protein